MATSSLLLGPNPLPSWNKQTSSIIFTLRHHALLPAKPIQFSNSIQHSYFAKYDPKLKCFSSLDKRSHIKSDNDDSSKGPLGCIFKFFKGPALPNALKTLVMAAVMLGLSLIFNRNSTTWAGSDSRRVLGKTPSSTSSSSSRRRTDSTSWFDLFSIRRDEFEAIMSSRSQKEPILLMSLGLLCLVWMLSRVVSSSPDPELRGAAKFSVVKLQVSLLDSEAQQIRKDLALVAASANTCTTKEVLSAQERLSHVLTAATTALLDVPYYWLSGYSYVTPNQNFENTMKCFRQFYMEERERFFNKSKGSTSMTFKYRYVVVTLLVIVQGKYTLPTINRSVDLKEALQTLKSIPSKNVFSAPVVWTPEREDVTLTGEELITDYPLHKILSID